MLTERSLRNLEGVHRDLVTIVANTKTPYPVIVTEGIRTAERQTKLLAEGKSRTLNSRHLTGHACDFAVVIDDKVTWEFEYYKECAKAFKATAKRMGYDMEWGGDWPTFKDGTHLQLSWQSYPLQANPKTPGNSKTIAAATVGFPIAAFIPQIFTAIKEMVGSLTAFDSEIAQWTQVSAVVLIAAFVVWERILKMKREGI